MENLMLVLFLLFFLGIIATIVLLIISFIKKDFKFTKRQILFSMLGCFIGMIVSIVLFGVFMSPETESKSEQQQIQNKLEEKDDKELNPSDRWNNDKTFKLESAPNTHEAELEIYEKAKEDANKYPSSAIPQIIDYIKAYSNDPWKDRATMEQMIYWGTVIEKSDLTTEKEKKVGHKAERTVSFVYRGLETEDDAKVTQEYLIKHINELNN